MSEQINSPVDVPLSQQLTQITIRIEATIPNEDATGFYLSTGTGFFFNFHVSQYDIPTIVTNKHVIANSIKGKLIFSKKEPDGSRSTDKLSLNVLNFGNRFIQHPKDDIDLCMIPLNQFRQELGDATRPYVRFLDSTNIPSDQQWSEFTSIEDIIMVGYPNGIWDDENNLPIIRKGITATSLKVDYKNQKRFLIDAAVFPGSSGSPVFVFNEGSFPVPTGLAMGSRSLFVGIASAVYQHTISGDIVVKAIPTVNKPTVESMMPNNLGVVIKSTVLKDFEPILLDLVEKQKPSP